jgi:hypothetical protein
MLPERVQPGHPPLLCVSLQWSIISTPLHIRCLQSFMLMNSAKWILLQVHNKTNSVLCWQSSSLQCELSLMMVVTATETRQNVQRFCDK